MSLTVRGIIEIPDAQDTDFDHAAFDAKTRRVFVAHTARGLLEVIDHDASRHIATLKGFPEAAGVVAHDGHVLVTNRGAASLAWVDAASLQTRSVWPTAPRPNGVAITFSATLGIAACIGDDDAWTRASVVRTGDGPPIDAQASGPPAMVCDERRRHTHLPRYSRAKHGARGALAGPG